VSNGDVYVAGAELIDAEGIHVGYQRKPARAKLWKNGAMQKLEKN
jgi:hypothetical protein